MVTIDRSQDLTVIGSNGAGWVGPLGTERPTSPLEQPLPPFAPLGATSDDGLVYGFDEDSQAFTPWGLTSPFRTTITKSIRTFKMTLWETARVQVQSIMYRIPAADLAPDEDGLTNFGETAAPTPDRRAWWFVVFDGDTARGFYVPQGEISDRDDVTFKQDTMSGYGITVTAYPDDANITVYHTDFVPVTPAYTGS
jgi:hypothetical protein